MPRYFFHVHDGDEYIDAEGTELVDLKTAQDHAVQIASDLLRHRKRDFWNGDVWQLEVTDQDGRSLAKLEFQASPPGSRGLL